MRFGEWDFVNASITNILSMPAFWLMYRSRDAKIKYESTSSTIGHTISTGWNPCHGIRPLRGYHPPTPPPCLDGWECFKKLWGSHCSNLLVLFFLTYIPHLPELKLMPTTSVNFFLLIFVDKTVEVERAIYEGWDEREIGEEECFLLFAAAAIQPLLPHCCHWAAPLMPLFSNAIFRRKKMANSNQYWKRNKNNVNSIWIVYQV